MTPDHFDIIRRASFAIETVPPECRIAMVGVDDLRALVASDYALRTSLGLALDLATNIVRFENTETSSRAALQLVRILIAATGDNK